MPARPQHDDGQPGGDRASGQAAGKAGYHHGDLYRALLDAAEALLAEGERDPGLRAVARRAGVSHAAPYKHFADGHDLRAAVAARGFDDLRERMTAAADAAEAGQRMRAVGRAYVAFALARPAAYHLMFGPEFGHGRATPTLARAQSAAFETLVALSGGTSAAGGDGAEGPSTGGRLDAVAAWSLVHGLATLLIDGRVAPPEGVDPLDFAVQALGRMSRPAG